MSVMWVMSVLEKRRSIILLDYDRNTFWSLGNKHFEHFQPFASRHFLESAVTERSPAVGVVFLGLGGITCRSV